MKKEEAEGYIMIGAAVFVGVAIIVVFNKGSKLTAAILEALGLKDTAEEKAAEREFETANEMGYFKDTYVSQLNPKTEVFKNVGSQKKVDDMVKTIESAIGYIYDQPEKIEGVFNSLAYKSQVCILAYNFKLKTKKDLLAFLNEKLDTDDQKKTLNRILKRTNNLPSGIEKKAII